MHGVKLNRLVLSIIALSIGYSKAGEYVENMRTLNIESALSQNYNVRFVFMNYGNRHSEKNLHFSFDFFYFRIIKDTNTWRFSFPLIPFFAGFMGMWGGGGPYERQRGLFDPGWDWGAVIPSLPLMLMNPMLAFPLIPSGNVSMGIGYNTDFIIIPRPQIYFAPKVQTEWLFPSGLGIATVVSYQVFDCFAIKRGVKFGLLLFVHMIEE
jgi:hypothetical protein